MTRMRLWHRLRSLKTLRRLPRSKQRTSHSLRRASSSVVSVHPALSRIRSQESFPSGRRGYLEVDGVEYFAIATGSIPAGYSEVDVIVDDNGTVIQCKMVAGHVGMTLSAKEPGGELNTLSPSTQWFMFEK